MEYQTKDTKTIKTLTELGFKSSIRDGFHIFNYNLELGKVLQELKSE